VCFLSSFHSPKNFRSQCLHALNNDILLLPLLPIIMINFSYFFSRDEDAGNKIWVYKKINYFLFSASVYPNCRRFFLHVRKVIKYLFQSDKTTSHTIYSISEEKISRFFTWLPQFLFRTPRAVIRNGTHIKTNFFLHTFLLKIFPSFYFYSFFTYDFSNIFFALLSRVILDIFL
jgi:hypothetical protein